jgi:hypothetical protein
MKQESFDEKSTLHVNPYETGDVMMQLEMELDRIEENLKELQMGLYDLRQGIISVQSLVLKEAWETSMLDTIDKLEERKEEIYQNMTTLRLAIKNTCLPEMVRKSRRHK